MNDDLILNHLWIVKSIAHRLKSSLLFSAEFDELVSAGNLALVKAARNYQARNNCQFKTYAFKFIRGDMIRSFTRIDGHHDSGRIQWEPLPENGSVPATQEAAFYRNEQQRLFTTMLDQLKPRQREVIDVYLRGDSLVAYATKNGWKRARVMKWQRTGIKQLKEMDHKLINDRMAATSHSVSVNHVVQIPIGDL